MAILGNHALAVRSSFMREISDLKISREVNAVRHIQSALTVDILGKNFTFRDLIYSLN